MTSNEQDIFRAPLISSAIIQRTVWLYFRFPLSFRDIEKIPTERGIDVSFETIRSWVLKLGPVIAATVSSRGLRPLGTWHLDEMFARVAGKLRHRWRAVDYEGGILEVLAQSRRNKRAVLKFARKLLKKQGHVPVQIVTDKLGLYSATRRDLSYPHPCHGWQAKQSSRSFA